MKIISFKCDVKFSNFDGNGGTKYKNQNAQTISSTAAAAAAFSATTVGVHHTIFIYIYQFH